MSLEKVFGIYVNCPLIIFKAKKCKLSARKGGFKAHNSYKIAPRDQISLYNIEINYSHRVRLRFNYLWR